MKTQLLICATGDTTGDKYPAMAKRAAGRWLCLLPELAGVTIATDTHAVALGLGHLDAIRRACAMKLWAFDLIPQDCDAVMYVDLDIFPHEPLAPSKALADVAFACVRDRWDDGEVARVATSVGIPPHQYFNAGLFYMRRTASAMLRMARRPYDRLKWYDQTGLNVARYMTGTATAWLPWRYNAMDRHDLGMSIACSHAPHHAWPAWEDGEEPPFRPLPNAEHVLSRMSFDHHYVTAPNHLMELYRMALHKRSVLDIGTFQGHSATVMAAAGAAVTSIDPENETRREFDYCHGLSWDRIKATSREWLAEDEGEFYDMIFHDGEHGPEIIPELVEWWDRILPGGCLAVHDAEQLDGWNPETLDRVKSVSVSPDARCRELMIILKLS